METVKAQTTETGIKARLRGSVLRVTYHNPENDYRVVKVLPESGVERRYIDPRGEVVLVGNMPGIEVGQTIEAEGEWGVHAKHGPQFKADWFKPSLPTGRRGIEAYLSSGAIKGVGEVIARRIVEAFGEETFEVLEGDIDRLRGVAGVNAKRFAQIRQSWSERRGDRELVVFLGDHGISPAWAGRLRRAYGDAALSIVRSNPYRLAAEVRGIGFTRADAMARQIGLAADAPERIDAALGHVLESQAGDGHTFLPREALIEKATELLGLDRTRVEERLEAMLEQKRLIRDEVACGEAIFLTSLHEAESKVAQHLKRLAGGRKRLPRGDLQAFLEEFQKRTNFTLAPAQREAVERIAREGALVLTGGPGTGKTTTLRTAIESFLRGGLRVKLAAPTGRAARRLAETSHQHAETIHRLLGYQPRTQSFAHGVDSPIEADLIVIDEASMLDAPLARDLFSAIDSGACLLLVGDEDQLPSVGPGNVLGDIIASGVMPVARLSQVFRQAEASLIVANAHLINTGRPPILAPPADCAEPDFFFIERDDPAQIVEAIETMVAERIPRKFGLDPIADIQVLTPMRRGELGVDALNAALQARLNPAPEAKRDIFGDPTEPSSFNSRLRVGDRVMQTANDYTKEVFNGDVGRVASIDPDGDEVIVQYEGRAVAYLADELRPLAPAYAVTIHKSQGSEYPAVVIPIHMQHYIMLRRNLIYTAITRGRRLVCMVGEKRALWRAIRNATRGERNSALKWMIERLDLKKGI
jgi:exodeoxyribonuclease V alpha subunit